MKFRILTILGLFAFLIAYASAETVERSSEVSELERQGFERDMEQRLARDTKAYLNHEFFIVQVSALLEKVDTWLIEEKQVEVPPPAQPQQAQQPAPVKAPPADPVVAQMDLETENSNSELQDRLGMDSALPGLPLSDSVFADARQRQREQRAPQPEPVPQPVVQPPPPVTYKTVKEEKLQNSRIRLKRQTVKVMLDEHVTQEQEAFVRNLVIQKANVNFIRGDELSILRSPFPGAFVLDPPVEEPVAVEEVIPEEEVKPELPLDEEPVAELPPEPEPVWKQWARDYWPIVAGVLLFIAIWYWLNLREKKREAEEAAKPPPPPPQTSDRLEELLKKMSHQKDAVHENRLQAIREEIVNMAITDQGMVTTQFSEWLAGNNSKEMQQLANLYDLMGEGLFSGLFGDKLPAEKLVAIAAKAMDLKDSATWDERLELAETAYQALMQRKYQEQHVAQEDIRPFSFLERLNDDQVLYLINEENIKVKALVFSQLLPERAASMLKRMNETSRTKIASFISQFDKLPISAFRDIANRLAKRAVHVPSFANISVEGVDVLIGMLDHMDTASEMALLGSLKRDNPDLYYQIKKVYISFMDLVKLPHMSLKNIIRETERETLALALYDMNDDFRQGIYGSMLDRPRAMLQSIIKNLNSPDEVAMSDAKRDVARRARAMLKAGEISREDAA